ncbi:MAG: F0F1 ATP synthase subunit gamma [Methylicorpusculum sp.]|uniref:F0F1 ATP synthase subunit gamma n=1 Tax=Methylicorpusculum sp. TaxID=2713644 RepID=UPI00271C9825|nr:F0F1 ATP synthase subunit gamma [Methylicorpusculum sp.]MDO8845725.1 F0F1 ATP synthase subunit gamma [Methylicorpusculum sp.]MDO8940449.1 F0F1 ATP synthase subunit gamma [Methylicorpusculum sp.]MDP2177334.1 F0F1 ATP synthase subunit gamma [Methylicorpusculum sp.]MDP3531019.1 F0F1 ATP synthase subunit gamma [Methylicorpusculum sp.]MDZ4152106.1 F0F1 ATP synthase subunit gamma [Methylicorpusculum sp.]
MAVGKEIRTKIVSIKNTQKITRAMEMVAASKMRKTRDRMQATRPYSKKISRIIRHLAQANPEYKHPFLITRDVKRVGIIVITSDRGLCGGLNSNLFRKALTQLSLWEKDEIEVDVCSIGSKGSAFFSRLSANLVGQVAKLGDIPHQSDIIGIIKIMLDAYNDGRIDELYVISNEFINTMTQKPTIEKLLPIVATELEEDLKSHWDYIYEPDAKELLDSLLIRYVESIVYQGLVENNACEQAARMIAMKSASDNAGNLISELQLIYNKARQAAITQEISEIVAGAAAV